MRRRELLLSMVSAIAAQACPCLPSFAAASARGCRLATDGSEPLQLPYLDASGYGYMFDSSCRSFADELNGMFGVKPALRFYDDSGSKNAFADPVPRFADGPDGSVVLGIGLLGEFRNPNDIWLGRQIDILIAHEFAHILQFKRAARDSWQLEPHADFMAGWAIARWHSKPLEYGKYGPRDMYEFNGGDQIVTEAETMFSMGDAEFNSPSHHGEPNYRAAMVRAGYEFEKMDLGHAFANGEKWAGLRK